MHRKLLENALRAIDKLMGDTSVTPEETIESLQELKEHCETLISSLES